MWLCVVHVCAPIDMQSMHRMSVCESMHLSHIPLCMQCVCLCFTLRSPDEVSFYSSICTILSPFPHFHRTVNIWWISNRSVTCLWSLSLTTTIVPIRQLLEILAQRIPKMHSFCGWINRNGISTLPTNKRDECLLDHTHANILTNNRSNAIQTELITIA